ncbi:MAG: hypothetical protein HKP61_20445 [Dactylosporangium sp.]|nr:hypothetical protein [Dactylosporangium sp.]NNJ63254.1 hypothetical protein [Dactylosporangium sp.]
MTQPPGYPAQPDDPYGQQGQPAPWPHGYPAEAPYGQPPPVPYPQAPQEAPYGQPHADPYAMPQGVPQPYPQPGQQVSGLPYGPGQPVSGGGYQQPAYGAGPLAPPAFAPGDQVFGPAPPKPGRGLLITMILLACLVVFGGVGTAAFLILGRSEGEGAASPDTAVDQFLTAVYKEKDAAAAEKIVCASARDSKAIRKRIEQLREYELTYKAPSYTWPAPTVESQQQETATVTATVTLTTSDDRVSEQRLKFLTVKGDGWLVCEINRA